jgi:hypothetical protein
MQIKQKEIKFKETKGNEKNGIFLLLARSRTSASERNGREQFLGWFYDLTLTAEELTDSSFSC